MAPFDKPVLSRVAGLRTGSGSPRTEAQRPGKELEMNRIRRECMVPTNEPCSLRQACPEQSRRAQDRLWLTTNGVVGELTTNRWFDRLITNGVVGELTTNRWFDELTTNGVVGELTTNRWNLRTGSGSPRTEFSAQSSLTGNMESHHERTLLSLHCRGHATRSSLRPGCGAGKHPGAGA
jgi:hypothetical protein